MKVDVWEIHDDNTALRLGSDLDLVAACVYTRRWTSTPPKRAVAIHVVPTGTLEPKLPGLS